MIPLPFILPNSREERGLAVLAEVAKVVRSRLGGRCFVLHGGWPYTDDALRQIVNTFAHRFDEVIRHQQRVREYLRQPTEVRPLEESHFEAELRAYLFEISNAPNARPDVTTWTPRADLDTRPGAFGGGHAVPGEAGVAAQPAMTTSADGSREPAAAELLRFAAAGRRDNTLTGEADGQPQ